VAQQVGHQKKPAGDKKVELKKQSKFKKPLSKLKGNHSDTTGIPKPAASSSSVVAAVSDSSETKTVTDADVANFFSNIPPQPT
jgi:hypothetical protein